MGNETHLSKVYKTSINPNTYSGWKSVVKEKKQTTEELNIDIKPIINFFKHNQKLWTIILLTLLVLTPMFFSGTFALV